MTSTENPILNNLRNVANALGKTQAEVAYNWLRAGRYQRPYNASKYLGVTKAQYLEARNTLRRLANV